MRGLIMQMKLGNEKIYRPEKEVSLASQEKENGRRNGRNVSSRSPEIRGFPQRNETSQLAMSPSAGTATVALASLA